MIVYDYYCKDCEKEYETILDHVPYECEHCGGYELTITWRAKAYGKQYPDLEHGTRNGKKWGMLNGYGLTMTET